MIDFMHDKAINTRDIIDELNSQKRLSKTYEHDEFQLSTLREADDALNYICEDYYIDGTKIITDEYFKDFCISDLKDSVPNHVVDCMDLDKYIETLKDEIYCKTVIAQKIYYFMGDYNRHYNNNDCFDGCFDFNNRGF